MALTLDQLVASPDHYLHAFAGDAAVFVPMDRAAYRRSIFLDDRIDPAGPGTMRLPIAALLPALRPAQPLHWIFHVAHCGSTLLARALEELDSALVLREPFALRQLAFGGDERLLALVRQLLSRRYDPSAPSLVKANVPVNFVLERILTDGPADRALLLHYALDDYLLAILRNPNHRGWVQRVTGDLAAYLGDLSALSDAERAAALWLAQTRRFAAALDRGERVAVLDAERFFTRPEEALAAVLAHFGRPADPAGIALVTGGPLFSTYSKNPEVAFDNAARLTRRAALEAEMAPELAAARAWIARTAPDAAELTAKLATRAV